MSRFRRGKQLTCIYTDERPDLCRELPNWMFDQGYCAGMTVSNGAARWQRSARRRNKAPPCCRWRLRRKRVTTLPRARRSGTIEIIFSGGARVCVRGEVSPETLRQVIELLR